VLPSIYPLFDQLAESIRAETVILNTLAELFTAERELVISGDVKALDRMTKKKRGLQRDLSSAAQATEQAKRAVCKALEIDCDKTALNRLPGYLLGNDDERACELTRRLEEHRLAAQSARESGLRTQELLRKSMGYVEHMVKMITQPQNLPSTYSSKGRLSAGGQPARPSITL